MWRQRRPCGRSIPERSPALAAVLGLPQVRPCARTLLRDTTWHAGMQARHGMQAWQGRQGGVDAWRAGASAEAGAARDLEARGRAGLWSAEAQDQESGREEARARVRMCMCRGLCAGPGPGLRSGWGSCWQARHGSGLQAACPPRCSNASIGCSHSGCQPSPTPSYLFSHPHQSLASWVLLPLLFIPSTALVCPLHHSLCHLPWPVPARALPPPCGQPL